MSVDVNHAFVSAKPASSDATKIDGPKWNAKLLFSAGAIGDLLYRDTGSATGASWLTGAAGLPYWSGAGVAPIVLALGSGLTITGGNMLTATAGGAVAETDITDGTILARLAAAETVTGAWAFNGIANAGLKVLDTDASHALAIVPGSNLSAARTLTLTTGDAARTVTLNGNPTLDDWFDQSVKAAASPTFADVLTLIGASAGSQLLLDGPAAGGPQIKFKQAGVDRAYVWYDQSGGKLWINPVAHFPVGISLASYLEGTEIADPAAPTGNTARLYVKDNGSGKTQLAVRFPTGAVQILATEP